MSQANANSHRRGSTVVEAALILLPFMAFVCAIIDVSLVMFMKNTVRYATRAGVRYGITGQTQSGMCQDASIKAVVQRNASGFLAGSTNLNRIQVRYYDPVTFEPATNRPGNVVEVSVGELPWSWLVPIWHSPDPVRISSSSTDVLESAPNGVVPCM